MRSVKSIGNFIVFPFMSYFSDIYHCSMSAVPVQLVSLENRRRISGIVDVLPKEFGLRTFGFECLLNVESADADFFVSTDVSLDGPAIMMNTCGDGSEFSDSGFECVRKFGAFWKKVLVQENNTMSPLVDDVWLEYDLRANPASLSAPGIFYWTHSNEEMDGDIQQRDLLINRISQAYLALTKTNLPTSLLHHLKQCFVVERNDKYSIKSVHIGMMISRKSSGLRLVINFPSPEAILSFLRGAGWPGSICSLSPFVEEWYEMADRVNLNIDISEKGLGMKLGFELSFCNRRSPAREPRWAFLLDYLVRNKMCCPSKMEGLMTYSGYQEYPAIKGIIAESSETKAIKDACRMFLIRKIFHIKVVYDEVPAPVLIAKGYFGVISYFRRGEIYKTAASG